jgi:hypothetical protein
VQRALWRVRTHEVLGATILPSIHGAVRLTGFGASAVTSDSSYHARLFQTFRLLPVETSRGVKHCMKATFSEAGQRILIWG